MEKYLDTCGKSGVESYAIGDNYIKIKFKNNNKIYSYSYQRAGHNHVEQMKKLAKAGCELHTYINKYVKDLYDR
jgi:hypothetical protein